MEIIYSANFDYECELAGLNSLRLRKNINERFEWIALWGIEGHALAVSFEYPEYYLSHIESFKTLPDLLPSAQGNTYWWGSLKNLKIERELNSKLFAAKLSQELFDFPFELLHKGEALEEGMVAKLDYSVSGRGLVTNVNSKEFSQCLFKEPLYKRACDIGSRYRKENGEWKLLHRSLNFIDSNFNFRGARLVMPFESEFDLKAHDQDQIKLLHHLDQRIEIESIQIDSFLYDAGGTLRHKPLGEFNFRRTMIDVAYHILHLVEKSEAEFILRAMRPLSENEWKQLREICTHNQVILLSPPQARDVGLLFLNLAKKDFVLNFLAHEFLKER